MLIDHGRRLGAAVAIHVVEIQRVDAMFAEGAFECDATIHRLGCVISHVSSVVLSSAPSLAQKVYNLRVGTAVADGDCADSTIIHPRSAALRYERAGNRTRTCTPCGTGS